eukprot:COSAG01_NODE_1845_length_9070_cov_16.651806_1_plen_809_part_00
MALLNVTLSALGSLALGVGREPWVDGGAIAFRDAATWFSNDCAALTDSGNCRTLVASRPAPGVGPPPTGTDALGTYTEKSVAWATTAGTAPKIITGVRRYTGAPDVALLTQHFPSGLEPQNRHGSTNEIVSAFPTLARTHLDLGVLMYEGVQLQNSRFFRWGRGSAFGSSDPGAGGTKRADGDGGAMPLLLTAADGGTLLASPLEDFFTSCQGASEQMGNFSFGLQGTLRAVPAGHTHMTLLVAGRGVRAATMRWGALLLRAAGGGKRRSMAWTLAGDTSLRSLSYYTDNGAYYYYQTANGTGSCSPPHAPCSKKLAPMPLDGTGYHQTMRQLLAYFKAIELPIAAVQYDSWWYYKGESAGIMLWEPMPSTLGGAELYGPPSSWLHLPDTVQAVTHSRFYQDNNMYLKGTAPGLPPDHRNWTWFVDRVGGVAVSADPRFFEHIFSRAKAGLQMATYEQDFLAKQYESCAPLQSEPGAGKSWLAAMAQAAEATNVTIQYCMALPRHILQSASFPRVTQARASHDYGQSRADDTEQWSSTGLTSMLYWSIGLLPFKDDFWSTTFEPANHWGAAALEVDPELQTLVSALLAGPVGPADAIGSLNRSRVMRSCRADGVLLKPHAPAMNLDSTFAQAISGDGRQTFIGLESVWATTMSANASPSSPTQTGTAAAAAAPSAHHLLFFANISSSGYTVHTSELQRLEAELRTELQLQQLQQQQQGLAPAATAAGQITEAADVGYVAREFYSGELRWVTADAPLHISHRPRPAHCAGMDPEIINFACTRSAAASPPFTVGVGSTVLPISRRQSKAI